MDEKGPKNDLQTLNSFYLSKAHKTGIILSSKEGVNTYL